MNSAMLTQELQTIQGRRRLLLPSDVVSWAQRHPESELHKQFSWDDKEAAAAYRLMQARELIKLIIESPPASPRWISLSIDRVEEGGYRTADDIENTPRLRQVLVRDVLAEFVRLRNRYPGLREFATVYRAIGEVEKDLDRAA
jgi:hypothetical protein